MLHAEASAVNDAKASAFSGASGQGSQAVSNAAAGWAANPQTDGCVGSTRFSTC